MNEKAQINEVPVECIHPYEKNPRDNTASIEKVAESIRAFGFLQPIVCDEDGVILAGHTRYQAALRLGLRTVPVIFANDLTPAQAKAYRLADNKAGENSKWLVDLLCAEMEAIEFDAPELDLQAFGFDALPAERLHTSWHNAEKRCGLKKQIALREKGGIYYASLFATGKTGMRIDEIKEDPEMIPLFADTLCDYILQTFGGNLADGDWCICTTPRRRHASGFHFATEICRHAAPRLNIPFRDGVLKARNRARIQTKFTLEANPSEHNIILYDDIITTGITIRDSRSLLIEAGHTVMPIISIRNQ